jgi:autotransporter translocation and assembly factor TamB
VDALGLELHGIEARLSARPAGERTLIQLSSLAAKARTTEVNFEGSGQLYLEGTQVIAGDAEILLRSVPITLEGLSVGKASGRASLIVERAKGWDREGPHHGKDYLVINLDLEDWDMKAARSAGRRLIEVDDNPEIIVLQTQSSSDSRPDRTPYRIFITLHRGGRFRFGDISLPLEGEARADQDGETHLSGELRLLPGSRLPIFGKRFDVLSGTIQLDPRNIGNPELDIALSGTTPEGNLVHVNISGTLQEPVLDPPPSELQALLGGGAATLIGGGVQALGFNELLGESVGAVELRVDPGSEERDDPSYAAGVQIGPDLWFEGGYQKGQDSGLNQSESDVFSGSVDYRFHRNWSLKTRLGNAGGGVDLLWQHRY